MRCDEDIKPGTFTLCLTCRRAIVAVHHTWADQDTGEQLACNLWQHVAPDPMLGIHDAEPMPSVLDVGVCPRCDRTTYRGRCTCGWGVPGWDKE